MAAWVFATPAVGVPWLPLVRVDAGDSSSGAARRFSGIERGGIEVSAILQTWPSRGAPGPWTPGGSIREIGGGALPQPGLVSERGEIPLPGSRGDVAPVFQSELAAASWNEMIHRIAVSVPQDPTRIGSGELDPDDAYRAEGCSFRNPQLCAVARPFFDPANAPGIRGAANGASAVPEPTGALLFAAGFALLAVRRKRLR